MKGYGNYKIAIATLQKGESKNRPSGSGRYRLVNMHS